METIFDLFVGLAGIAGVFVGFGALVILSEHNNKRIAEMHLVRTVVAIGLLTLISALIPVGLVYFNLGERLLWGISGAGFLTLIWVGLLHPTNRPVLVAMIRTNIKASLFFWLVLEPIIQVPLILCVLGYWPEYHPAFYMTAVIINLIQCAQTLIQVVYSRVENSKEVK